MLDAGRVAARAKGAKVRKYRAEVERSGLEFRPFGLGTYGAWGPGAQRVLRQLLAYADAHGGGDTRPRYLWTAPHVAEAARQLIVVARVRGIALALVKSAAQRRRPSRGLDREHMDADFAHLRSSTPSSREAKERFKLLPQALGAFGKGFIGIHDYRTPNNNESTTRCSPDSMPCSASRCSCRSRNILISRLTDDPSNHRGIPLSSK